ncbi:uncharacterized protein MEPE_05114 [Melanopsichium pennsylvanicum]|uniref:Uncharacterized protein n=1 Tax=Melanopsichium pennsylvanicum TaxID=63383 RepID=A0AAJ4XPH8_9BASI|nr:uncharacterized protein MEPE_05114 [Melanopsichium pennsylvanicum]
MAAQELFFIKKKKKKIAIPFSDKPDDKMPEPTHDK